MTDGEIPVMRPRLPDSSALKPYLDEIGVNGWYSNFGPLERRFEARLAAMFGLAPENLVCVGNGTVGLMLALLASAPERGGYCVLPSYTFVASAHAVLAAGLVPYFVDVDRESWSLTPEIAQKAIRAVDGRVAAVMVVSPFGAPLDMAAWDAFADANGVPVVADAAAGFDSARAASSAVVVSLHATKVLGAGEGGFVMSRNASLVRSIGVRSNFGFRHGRHASASGFNGKLNEYGAAVGLASLDAWPDNRTRLAQVTRRYADALRAVGNIRLAPGFGDGWVGSTCNIAFNRPVADTSLAWLAGSGIDCRQWWGKGCHREEAFAGYPCGDLSNTEFLAERVLGLPFHAGLTAAEIARVADAAGAAAQR